MERDIEINFDEEREKERERIGEGRHRSVGPIGIAKHRFTIADEHGSTIGRR